jgi:hypothetical protein
MKNWTRARPFDAALEISSFCRRHEKIELGIDLVNRLVLQGSGIVYVTTLRVNGRMIGNVRTQSWAGCRSLADPLCCMH